jgi:uncharacterized protein YdeI (YjbR/CyaY-like superfamily)
MPAGNRKTHTGINACATREEWRKWLSEHHDSETAVWLVFPRRGSEEPSIAYEDAVEDALCFGWIDSIVKRLDDDRYARKFTPRKPGSRWSTLNRRRYADLEARGLLAAPGLERAPSAESRSGDAPRPSLAAIPAYIEKALKSDARAWKFFGQLAPSYRRAYIGWIDSAKREDTKAKRLQESIGLLAAGRKLGLK